MKRRKIWAVKYAGWIVSWVFMEMVFAGCQANSSSTSKQSALGEQKVFALKEITARQAADFLSQLRLGTTSIPADRNGIAVAGTAGDLYRAGTLLDLVDTRDEFVIKTLGPGVGRQDHCHEHSNR